MYNSDLANMWGTIALALIVTILVILICRELVCWYYKINKIVVLMEDQNELLRKLLANKDGSEVSKEYRNPLIVENGLQQPETQVTDEILMKRYNISLENDKYVYSGYQYDNLKDAVNYARIFERQSK